jgi:dCTP deaminase
MILSNIEIHRALDAGDIILDPQPQPRFASITSPDSPYDTTAVNIRLGDTLSVCENAMPIAFDLRKKGLPQLLGQIYKQIKMDSTGGYALNPQKFLLGNTVERLELPIKDDRPVYAARVEGRSSFARCGLLIHFTAPTIHAGFNGTITFEIMNLGMHDIILHPGIAIGQLIFERVAGIPNRNDSQFQGQSKATGEKT